MGTSSCTPSTANAVVTTYVYDAAGQLAAEYGQAPDSGTKYLFADALGSTRLETSSVGGSARCLDYTPFGNELPQAIEGHAMRMPATRRARRTRGFRTIARDSFSTRDAGPWQSRFSSVASEVRACQGTSSTDRPLSMRLRIRSSSGWLIPMVIATTPLPSFSSNSARK